MRQRVNLADKLQVMELIKNMYTDGTDDETTTELDCHRTTGTECFTPVGENSPIPA